MTQQIMTTYEGGAVAYQLAAMIKALEPYEVAAKEAGDTDALALLGHLRSAYTTARQIEQRAPLESEGVKLTRN